MLSGVAGAPESYFMPGNAFSNSIIVGAAPVLTMLAGASPAVRFLMSARLAPEPVRACSFHTVWLTSILP